MHGATAIDGNNKIAKGIIDFVAGSIGNFILSIIILKIICQKLHKSSMVLF